MTEPVGVAVVGLDHWYSAFMALDEIAAEEEMRLAAVAERNPQRLEEARQQYAPEAAVTDYRAILDDESIELVFSFVNTAENVEVCREALGRGKHTLCVKPAALTVEDAAALAAAADDAGVFWSSFETYHRLTERGRFLKRLLQEGLIGEAISYYHVAHGGLPQPWKGQTGDSWWLHPDRTPGGAWIDHAIYAVDQVRWLLDQEVESVSAVMGSRRHTHLELEDYGIALMRMESGFTALMEDTWTADSGTHFNRFVGTDGSLEPGSAAFTLHRRGQSERIEVPQQERGLFRPLARAARGREALPFRNSDSVHNLAACMAAYESARTGRAASPA